MNILMRLERAFGVEPQAASEWLLDYGQLEALNAFFEANGAKVLMVAFADQNFNVHSTASKLTLQCCQTAFKRLWHSSPMLPVV